MKTNTNNEALIKYLEEFTGGLAKEEPIIATPLSRKNTGGAMRADSFAKLLIKLSEISEEHANAAFTIATAYRMGMEKEHYRTTAKMWLSQSGGLSVEEAELRAIKITEQYKKWSDYMIIHNMNAARSMTIDVVALGLTFSASGLNHRKDYRTVKKMIIDACDVFVSVNKRKREEHSNASPAEKVKKDRGFTYHRGVKIIEVNYVDEN